MEVRQREAVTKFAKLAELKDNEQPSFVSTLIKSVITAAIGHLGGYIIGAAGTKVSSAFGKAKQLASSSTKLPEAANVVSLHIPEVMTGTQVIQRIVDVSTDTVQGVVGAAQDAAQRRMKFTCSRILCRGMQIDVVDRMPGTGNISWPVKTARSRRSNSTGSLVLETLMDAVHDAYFEKTTQAWTSYVAQSRLGLARPSGNAR